MASLMQEYRERHGMNFVLAMDEGICFFDCARKPGAVVLSSSHSRNIATCMGCLKPHSGLVAEIFVPTGLPHPSHTFRLYKHEHVEPDVDLRKLVNNALKSKDGTFEPYLAQSDRDLECWLWRFFIRHNPMFSRKWLNKEEPFRSLEQMAWVLTTSMSQGGHSRLFESFYKGMYYTFMLGRKYMLYA